MRERGGKTRIRWKLKEDAKIGEDAMGEDANIRRECILHPSGQPGMGRAWEKARHAFCTQPGRSCGQPGMGRAWENHGRAWEPSGRSAFCTRPASQAWQEHGKSMGEHGKHQARVHSAPVWPARHEGKAWESLGNISQECILRSSGQPGTGCMSMGKAWERTGNIRRECMLHPSSQPGMARAWEKHGRAWET